VGKKKKKRYTGGGAERKKTRVRLAGRVWRGGKPVIERKIFFRQRRVREGKMRGCGEERKPVAPGYQKA